MVLTYIVPIITMAILYYQVGRELWGYQVIGEHVDLQQRALLAKKKVSSRGLMIDGRRADSLLEHKSRSSFLSKHLIKIKVQYKIGGKFALCHPIRERERERERQHLGSCAA